MSKNNITKEVQNRIAPEVQGISAVVNIQLSNAQLRKVDFLSDCETKEKPQQMMWD